MNVKEVKDLRDATRSSGGQMAILFCTSQIFVTFLRLNVRVSHFYLNGKNCTWKNYTFPKNGNH